MTVSNMSMTKIKRSSLALAGALAFVLLSAAGPANAASVEQAQYLIVVVQTTLAGVDIGGRNADRTRNSLESKLKGASVKLDQAKFKNACVKLMDFIDKVGDLAIANAKGVIKIGSAAATQLQDEAGDAKAEVQYLGSLDLYCE